MFNTLKYSQRLEKAGFTKDQAEVSIDALYEVMNTDLEKQIKELRQELRIEMKDMEHRLTVKMGLMGVSIVSILYILLKLT